jgi:hypothetical protein
VRSVPALGSAPASSIEGLSAVESDDDPAQSVAEIPPPHVLPGINDDIDQLTADLAAFCIDQFERNLTLGNEDQGFPNDFEDELRVRDKLKSKVLVRYMLMAGLLRTRRLWQRKQPARMQ